MVAKEWVRVCKGTAVVGLTMIMFGCGGGESTDGQYTDLWNKKFNTCGVNCHSSGAADGTENGPDLSTKDSFYNDLVGKSAANYPNWLRLGDCNTDTFIHGGDAAHSTMMASLVRSYSDHMSQTQGCTTALSLHDVNHVAITDQALIDEMVAWINNGALN
ncbi:MAG: hypothetical protein KJ950_13310 [Proteobacteria bacterium]|nr:hypothetical protein [Pseudomonadota bacterium]MBU1686147.1 hypothetical protein [Pseudomonadota bacterium]